MLSLPQFAAGIASGAGLPVALLQLRGVPVGLLLQDVLYLCANVCRNRVSKNVLVLIFKHV